VHYFPTVHATPPILSVCTGMLEPLPLDRTFAIVSNAGLDAVELLGEPRAHDPHELREMLARHGLRVTGLTAAARLPTGRDLAHPDAAIRERTIVHLGECIALARMLGAPFVAVAPSAIGRYWLEAGRDAEWAFAVNGLAQLAEIADVNGVAIGLEVLNRYVTPTVTTVKVALRMIEDAGGGALGLVFDLFHAALEERSIPDAIRAAGDRLLDVQVADNTREAPGRGSLDFKAIAQALVEVGYVGPLALEAFPRGCGAFPAVADEHLAESITYIEELRPFFSALPMGVSPTA
jgi:D-psicose/D-tagatose/L-ribulose 3-epimerase